MKTFMYLLTVLVLVSAVAIMILGNVFVGIVIAALYGMGVCAIALVTLNADTGDEWER